MEEYFIVRISGVCGVVKAKNETEAELKAYRTAFGRAEVDEPNKQELINILSMGGHVPQPLRDQFEI
jgi:hypothetical protein